MRYTVVGCSVAIWRRSISSCSAWTDQRTQARPASSGGVQARAVISTRCRGGKPRRTTAAGAVSKSCQAFLGEASAPAYHPVAGPMEIGGDGHVAPPQHRQKDHVGAVGQPALGCASPAEMFKGGTFLGGQRNGHGGRGAFSASSDGCVHRRCDLCCNVCGYGFRGENTSSWTELLLLSQNLSNGVLAHPKDSPSLALCDRSTDHGKPSARASEGRLN